MTLGGTAGDLSAGKSDASELVSGICDDDRCGIVGDDIVAFSCDEVGLKFGSWTASEYVGRLQTSLRWLST